MKLKLIIIILLCIVAALAVLGLFRCIGIRFGDPISGGVTDNTNLLAPKTIQSTELTSFYTFFYRFSDDKFDASRQYSFHMTKTDDGMYYISEGYGEDEIKCETDADFAAELDRLIRAYDLIRKNGVYRVTAGLPPEYGPWEMKAIYASNEELSFRENGNPSADWTRAILDLFANEFAENGINDFLSKGE